MEYYSNLLSNLVHKRERILSKKKKQYASLKQQEKIELAVIEGKIVQLTKNGIIIDGIESYGTFCIGDSVVVQVEHPHYSQVLPLKHTIYLYEKPTLIHFDPIGAIYCNEAGIHIPSWRDRDEKSCLFTPHLFQQCHNIQSTPKHVLAHYKEYLVIYTRETMVSIKALKMRVSWATIFDIDLLFYGLLYIQDNICKFDVCNQYFEKMSELPVPFSTSNFKITKYGVLAISDFKVAHLDMMKEPRVQTMVICEENDLPILDAFIFKTYLYIMTEEGVQKHHLEKYLAPP
eukprot:NODE_252_length_11723_cov_1.965933.p6 type:complete len:288 gc:universal NODE_252_length_11723_cov_1.965933:4004-3141(-)